MRLMVAGSLLFFACMLCVLPAAADPGEGISAAPEGNLTALSPGGNAGNLFFPRVDGSHPFWASRFFQETIPPGTSRSWIDLKWNPVPGPYTLYVYSPEEVLGPYGNMANGIQDNRIFLEIDADRNLTPGSWYYQVRGGGDPASTGYSFETWQNTGGA